MGKLILTIDGYIGPFGYSKQWLKQMLEGHDKDEVIINISSLGGRVDDALSMHDQIKEHGNVTVNFTSFVASSATIIGMGARHRQISENAFFLVHKVMSWVDEFGLMNEDDIETLIQKLEKEKNENAKITLVMARIYSRVTSKPIAELLDLMKQDTWINAQEAKEWGFVDQVYEPGESVNILDNVAKVAMITAAGLPDPTSAKQVQNISASAVIAAAGSEQKNNKVSENLIDKFFARLSEFVTPKTSRMKKQFVNVNKTLGVDSLESAQDGIYINEDQLEQLDQAIQSSQQDHDDLATTRTALQTAESNLAQEQQARQNAEQSLSQEQQARQNSESALSELITQLGQVDNSIAEAKDTSGRIAAIRALLAKRPGARHIGAIGKDEEGQQNDGVDWETLSSLPHMQENE
jgi:ATP-dependent Clp protease, protease subunit